MSPAHIATLVPWVSAIEERGDQLRDRPRRWQRYPEAAGLMALAPLIAVSLAYALGHFVEEARFNRALRGQLADRPLRAESSAIA
jgi:hypothetical protein